MPSTRCELTVTVKLFANLRQRAPEGTDPRGFAVVLPTGATLGDLVTRLELPEKSWRLAFRNGRHCAPPEALQDGDVVAFFPPIAGG